MNSGELLRYSQAKAIVNDVFELPAEERARRIEERCAGDAELRAEVDWLLEECLRTGVPLIEAQRIEVTEGEIDETPPPGYRILGLLGRGGMGTVYLAERDGGGFKQRVALKMLNFEALLLPFARQHFERERQILAELAHPNVSSLIDGGTTDDGRPYLAMEFVDGQRIDHWCTQQRVDVRDRVRLMIQVCQAVEHAHSRLIIHRDIKPSNILITPQRAPKLLDFGIARPIDDAGAAHFQTQGAQGLMTLAYAAPEQIKGQTLTTAVDIYALGVVLYELLTATNPHATTGNLNQHDMIRAICDAEVPAPSVVLARRRARRQLGVTTTEGAALASSRWTAHTDLDHIVMRALRKDPAQRYPSVAALADDLQAFLDSRPIAARHGETLYRWRRFVARHSWGVAFTVILAGLMIGFTYSRQALLEATQRERVRAEATVAFVTDIFKSTDPSEAQGRKVPVADVLGKAAGRVGEGMAQDPALQASLMRTIGDIYANLGLMGDGGQQLTRALTLCRAGACAPQQYADTLISLSNLKARQGHAAEGAKLAREILDPPLSQAPLTPGTIANAWIVIADGANEEKRGAPEVLTFLDNAERALGPPSDRTRALRGMIFQKRASHYVFADDYANALAPVEKAYALLRDANGELDPDTLATLRVKTEILMSLGRYQEAADNAHQVSKSMREVLGDQHPWLANALMTEAMALQYQRDDAKAIPLLDEAARIAEHNTDADPFLMLRALGNRGSAFLTLGRSAEALRDFQSLVAFCDAQYGRESLYMGLSLWGLGNAQRQFHQYAEAEASLNESLAVLSKVAGDDKQQLARLWASIGDLRKDMQRDDATLEAYAQAVALSIEAFGEDHEDTAFYHAQHGAALVAAQRVEEGAAEITAALTRLEKAPGKCETKTQDARNVARDAYAKIKRELPAAFTAECPTPPAS